MTTRRQRSPLPCCLFFEETSPCSLSLRRKIIWTCARVLQLGVRLLTSSYQPLIKPVAHFAASFIHKNPSSSRNLIPFIMPRPGLHGSCSSHTRAMDGMRTREGRQNENLHVPCVLGAGKPSIPSPSASFKTCPLMNEAKPCPNFVNARNR